MSGTLQTFIQIASRILNRPVSELDPDLPIQELGFVDRDWRNLVEEVCDTHGVPLTDIIDTMPTYHFQRSGRTLGSLREAAAFSDRAACLLGQFTTRLHLDTLRSLTASVEDGRYVESGLLGENLHRPNSRVWVLGKLGALSALALGLPLYNAFGPCTPLCSDCFAPVSTKFWEMALFTLPWWALMMAIVFGPAVHEIWKDQKNANSRGPAPPDNLSRDG